MRRLFAILAAALLALPLVARQQVKDLDIKVTVNRDGSAGVVQTWSVYVDEGTEWYIPVQNLGPMTVENLQVSEGGTAFESMGRRWDVDWTRSRKAGKCGMVPKSDGAELCWGIGEYGDHVWTVSFTLTGLVMGYDDADALIFTWIPAGMGASPEHARVTIVPGFDCPQWTYDNTRVWGFGFYGDINVADGAVVAETSESMGYSSKLITLVKFNSGVFEPTVVRGGPVQDMIDKALDGSSYGEDDDDSFFLMLFGLLFCGGLFLIIWAGIASALGYKWKKSLFGKTKIEGWYRDVPLEGNLQAAYYLLSKGKRFEVSAPANSLIGAYFLRWILSGAVRVESSLDSKNVNLTFLTDTVSSDAVEQDLFRWARIASGGNLVLEKGEFEKWSKKNYQKLMDWPGRASGAGKEWFRDHGYFLRSGECNTDGQKEACHLVEFQNFLKDFTISDQREAVEVKLWKDYLVYAQLFGIADKVAKQFKKLYPAEFQELAQQTGMDVNTLNRTILWSNSMSTRAFGQAVAKAGNINGTGGHTSFGGGGGSFGGGFGGGAR